MPIVTVIYGPAYDGKNGETFAQCLEKIRRHRGGSCVYLVRSDVRVRQLRDLTFKECSGCFHFPVSTFPDFVSQLYSKMPGSKRILGAIEQTLLLESILAEREQRLGKQFYFRHFHEHPGIVTKIKEFLTGIRRSGLTSAPQLAEKLAECQDVPRYVHKELLSVFACYTERLNEAHVIDDTGIFLEMAQKAVSDQLDIRRSIPSPELFVLEGYYELTQPEQQIFTALCEQFERTIMTLDLPRNPYNLPDKKALPKAFLMFQDMVRYIQRSGFSVREFPSSHSPSSQGAGMLMERVSVRAYRDRKEEVTEIAREIRTLHRKKKISALSEVGVAFPIINQYERLIREIFPCFGIPFTMFQGYSLASSAVVITIFRIFQVVLDEYSPESLGKLFSSPLVYFEIKEQDTSCTPAFALNPETCRILDLIAREAGIVSGRNEWIEKLTAYQNALEERQAEQDSSSGDNRLPPRSDYHLPPRRAALPTILRLLDLLSRFETERYRPFEEFIRQVKETIHQFHIPHGILQTKERKIRENDLAALRKFLNVLEMLQQELSSSGKNPRPAKFSLREFYDLLRIAVQAESYYPPETLDDSVFVMGRLDTRQVQFRYLFFGGLVEKDFPGQADPNIFVSDQEAEIIGLPSYKKTLQETDHLFYLNTLNPTERLYLSYPMQEEEKDLLRSVYIDRITALPEQEGQKISQDEGQYPLESQASCLHLTDRLPENIYTYTDLYQWLGTQIFSQARPWEDAGKMPAIPGEVLKYIAQEKGKEYVDDFLNGLRAQALRMTNELSSFDGMLMSGWSKNILDYRYRKHVYSPSEFDLYVRCPIKFFFRRLLRLEPLPGIILQPSAPDIGKLLHAIVYRFYTDTSTGQSNARPGEVDDRFLRRKADKEEWISEARNRMAAIAAEEIASYDFSGAFWDSFIRMLLAGLPVARFPELQRAMAPEQQGILAKFIELEANDSDKTLPRYLEAHFGMAGFFENRREDSGPFEIFGYQLAPNPYTLEGKDCEGKNASLKLRGKIDRIDLEPRPENFDVSKQARNYKAVIYDYKTGGVPSVQKVKDGRSFQLPLYILALQKLLGDTCKVVAGGYYQMKTAGEIGKKGLLGSKEHSEQHYFKGSGRTLFETYHEFLSLLEEYANHAIRATEDIRQGRFHPTTHGPQEAGCSYCEYQQICRVDHQRMSKIQE